MANVVKCGYLHSNEYRGFVHLLAMEGLSISSGTWWVERTKTSLGIEYVLYNNKTCFGGVSVKDAMSGDVSSALWKLVEYLGSVIPQSNWSILVFPRKYAYAENYKGSNEFTYFVG